MSLAAEPSSAGAAVFAGHLQLVAAPGADGGRTVIAQQSFRAPFHLGKSYWDGRALQVQIVNPTAGILAGDRLDLAIAVRSGASLLVTTPAAARAFVMQRRGAICRQEFRVESGAWLEYTPEPLCPHRECEYTQATRLEVARGGEVFWADAFAPGRVGGGERWSWRRLRLGLDLAIDGELILRERCDGSGAELARAAEFFGTPAGWCATVVIVSERIAADDPVWQRVRALGASWLGLTRLRGSGGGWILRAVVQDGQALRDLLRELRAALAEKLSGLRSDLRKL